MTARVLVFKRHQRLAVCAACAGHFKQLHPHHLLCPRCYWWSIGLHHFYAAKTAFDRLRRDARGVDP